MFESRIARVVDNLNKTLPIHCLSGGVFVLVHLTIGN